LEDTISRPQHTVSILDVQSACGGANLILALTCLRQVRSCLLEEFPEFCLSLEMFLYLFPQEGHFVGRYTDD